MINPQNINMHYAGIGARATPPQVLKIMSQLASKLESMGYLLRSGGAAGADAAFERGVRNPAAKQIYLPSKSFNSRYADNISYIDATTLPNWNQAIATVNQFHPAPERLSDFARNLMARNAMQVLGSSMNQPAKMVVAWTPGGQTVGGTGQALRIAQAHGIPIRNLGDPNVLANVQTFLQNNMKE
jgi:hypothetical protein